MKAAVTEAFFLTPACTTLFLIIYRRQVVPFSPVYTQLLPKRPASGTVLRTMLYKPICFHAPEYSRNSGKRL